ncbi:MAG: peptide cleavage/export ABC transporter [Turicibacter sp.]|nr:peptide cleavage/export ABC transporter [Turicibacter sp.]
MPNKYKTIKQKDIKDCGAACIATILKRFGSSVPISIIREIAGTSKTGTNMFGLAKTLEHYHFETKAIRANMDLFKDPNLPYPAIAQVLIDGVLQHYVVVQKVDKHSLVISDPGCGTIKMKKSEFEKIWQGIILFCVPAASYAKFDETQDSLGKIFRVFMKDWRLVFHTVMASLLVILISVLTSFYFQTLVDTLIPQGSRFNLHMLSIGVIVFYVFQSLFELLKNYLLTILGNRMSVRVMLGYFHHVLKLPMNFFATRQSGEIISRFMDASKVINALATATLTMALDVTMIVVVGVIMLLNNSTLFFIMLGVMPLYLLVILLFVKLYEKANHKEMEQNSLLNSYIIESLNGIETIKATNAEKQIIKKMDRMFMNYIEAAFKSFNIANTQNFLKMLIQVSNSTLILWIGATFVMEGELSFGQLITFSMLISYFSGSVQNIINLQPELQSAKVAAERLDDVLIISPEEQQADNRELASGLSFENGIEVKNLSFNYPMKRICLDDVSFSIRHGDKVAFVGKSGAGKSTLAKLLVKFYPINTGKIIYDGYHLGDIDNTALRQNVTMIPQTSFFFTGSLYDNLVFGIEGEVPFPEIERVCRMANILEFIEEQPQKFNFFIEENAGNLSGGQKQRLAIARALLRKPKVMILDEATSNIDGMTEKKIMGELYGVEDMTLIFISHNLTALAGCSNILVFDKGTIAETGTHQELLEKRSLYWSMCTG